MWTVLFLTLAVAACPVRSDRIFGTFLATHLNYDYFKVRVGWLMDSGSIRSYCLGAGYRAACNGPYPCQFEFHCNHYDVFCKTAPMFYVAKVLGCGVPIGCSALEGVYTLVGNYFTSDIYGVENGNWPVISSDPQGRYALCARDVNVCSSAPCQNGATCQDGENSITCRCVPGYSGIHCEEDNDECSPDPCQNGASCQDGVNSFTCQCVPGYTGTLCEDINDCFEFGVTCQNGVPCQDGLNSFTCQCVPGYTGTLCETDIDECASSPCLGGETCLDHVNSYSCVCSKGHVGDKCVTVAVGNCASSSCSKGSTCLDVQNGHTCLCAPGYGGNFCETDIDECSSDPCQNAATCQDGVNSFTCQCAPGYTGPSCEIDIDECASNPCWASGTCLNRIDGYSCVCPKGVRGDRCETVMYMDDCLLFSSDAVSYSEASQECQTRGGHLVDVKEALLQRLIADTIPTGSDVSPWIGLKMSPGVMTYADGTGASESDQLQWSSGAPPTSCDLCAYLDSTDEYRAQTASCLEQHHYVCKSDPKPCEQPQDICFNNAVCSTCFNDSYTFCSCLPGWEGVFCNLDIDECASHPCQNGGSCFHDLNSYFCHCPIGYGGDNCQIDPDLCAQVVCPFNWQCQDQGNHFICLAGTTRLAKPYECSSASCPDGMYCREEGPASFSCRAR